MHKKRGFPLWIPCLLLFVLLVVATVYFIRGRVDTMQKEAVVVPSEAEPTAEMTLPLDDADNALLPDLLTGSEETEAADVLVEDAEADAVSDEAAIDSTEAGTDEFTVFADGKHVHHFVNGVCDRCGSQPVFYTDRIPEELLEASSSPGTVTLHEYKVTNYGNHGFGEIDKCFNVYLPYGYEESRQYPVLVLIHGAEGNQDSWLTEEHQYDDDLLTGKALLDRMIELGYCEPCIVVSPAFETKVIQGLTAALYQMRDELRTYILPYIVDHYSTYAADSSLESISAARDYFALGGLSNGALFVYEGGMRYNFDLFGNYAAFSGNGEPWKTVSAIQSDAYADFPVHCLFTGAGGDTDIQQHYTEIGYDYFIENDTRFRDGENAWHVDVTGGHTWKAWLTELCNALPVLFP